MEARALLQRNLESSIEAKRQLLNDNENLSVFA